MLFWVLVMVVLVILTALFFAMLKVVWKAVLSAICIIFLLSAVFGAIAFLDAKDFADKSKGPGQVFILSENGRMLAGAKDLFMQNESTNKTLSDKESSIYSSAYAEKDYQKMLSGNYKLFIFDMKAFDSLSDDDLKEFQGITKDSLFRILRSENAVDEYADDVIKRSGVPKEQEELVRKQIISESQGEAETRSKLFIILFISSVKSKGTASIIGQYRQGNIGIYPKTMLFRALKVMPQSVLSWAEGFLGKPEQAPDK